MTIKHQNLAITKAECCAFFTRFSSYYFFAPSPPLLPPDTRKGRTSPDLFKKGGGPPSYFHQKQEGKTKQNKNVWGETLELWEYLFFLLVFNE